LAEGLADLPGIRPDTLTPPSNMVYAQLEDQVNLSAPQVADRLMGMGVGVGVVGARRFRLVTHYWIDDAGILRTVDAFRQTLALE
jgi:threonine aldolase